MENTLRALQTDERTSVFIAEDNVPVRERLVLMLERHGAFSVVGQAGTPGDAVSGILATHPDTVILDVHLLGGNGLEVLRKVRPAEPGIAFVVLTNHPNAQYRKAFMAAGACCVLDKSTEFLKLPATLTAVATRRHGAHSARYE